MFAPRYNADELISLDFNDRRRLAMEELRARAEADEWSPIVIGQTILHHATTTDEVVRLSDEIVRRIRN